MDIKRLNSNIEYWCAYWYSPAYNVLTTGRCDMSVDRIMQYADSCWAAYLMSEDPRLLAAHDLLYLLSDQLFEEKIELLDIGTLDIGT